MGILLNFIYILTLLILKTSLIRKNVIFSTLWVTTFKLKKGELSTQELSTQLCKSCHLTLSYCARFSNYFYVYKYMIIFSHNPCNIPMKESKQVYPHFTARKTSMYFGE